MTASAQERLCCATLLGNGYAAVENPQKADSFFAIASDAALTLAKPSARFAVWEAIGNNLSDIGPRTAWNAVAGLAILCRQYPDSPRWAISSLIASAQWAAQSGDTDGARAHANDGLRMLEKAHLLAAPHADALIQIGSIFETVGPRFSAFRAYLDARQLAAENRDPATGALAAAALANFCSDIGDYDRAENFAIETLRLDSLAGVSPDRLWEDNRTLADATMRRGDPDGAMIRLERIVDWALTHDGKRIADDALATLRTGLLERDDYEAVSKLYQVRYPQELRRAEVEDPFLHARLLAVFAVAAGDTATALAKFQSADSVALATGAGVFQLARFRQLWSEILRGAGKRSEAETVLLRVYDAIKTSDQSTYVAEAAAALDFLAQSRGDYQAAYKWARVDREARTAASEVVRADDLLRSQLQSEEHTRANLATRKKEESAQNHNLQFTIIAIAIILAFIGILMARSAHVSARTLRVISFLSFILLFEFIILLADLFFHVLTHGEPWQLILIKLVFIAGLSQVHHWLEHKLAHYLASHEPLTEFSRRIKSWWHRSPQQQTTTASVTPHIHPPSEPSEPENEIL